MLKINLETALNCKSNSEVSKFLNLTLKKPTKNLNVKKKTRMSPMREINTTALIPVMTLKRDKDLTSLELDKL